VDSGHFANAGTVSKQMDIPSHFFSSFLSPTDVTKFQVTPQGGVKYSGMGEYKYILPLSRKQYEIGQ